MSEKKTKEKSTEKNICFVIMPFRGWFNTYYKDIYKPSIEKAGLIPVRADDIFRPGIIVKDIWELTKASKIILADLTGQNPNVFYELGLAHAIAKPVILVTETLDDIPFDLQALRVIDYDKNQPNWNNILQDKITQSITEIIENPKKSILATFLDIDDIIKPDVPSLEKEIMNIKQELESFKRLSLSSSQINSFDLPISPSSYYPSDRPDPYSNTVIIPIKDGLISIPNPKFTTIKQMITDYSLGSITKEYIIENIPKIHSPIDKEEAEDIFNFLSSNPEIK